jgi:hypothetical protein
MQTAQEWAEHMAAEKRQGHGTNEEFLARATVIQNLLGDEYTVSVAEICAESYPWEENDPPEKLWPSLAASWKGNSHWDVAGKRHGGYGCGIAKGKNNVWYGCVQVCDP